jgi:hypothetical protein
MNLNYLSTPNFIKFVLVLLPLVYWYPTEYKMHVKVPDKSNPHNRMIRSANIMPATKLQFEVKISPVPTICA